MWKKRRNCSFSHSVFRILVQQTRKKPGLVWKRVKSLPNNPWFVCVNSTILLKTLREKEKLLVTSNFSFSHIVFYPFRELSATLTKFEIVICKLSQFGRVKIFSFGKGLMYLTQVNLLSLSRLICIETFCCCQNFCISKYRSILS